MKHEASNRLITVLKEGKSLEQAGFDESLFHLLSAGFSQIVSLNQAQAEVIEQLVPQGHKNDEHVKKASDMMQQAQTVLGEINLSLLQTQKKRQNPLNTAGMGSLNTESVWELEKRQHPLNSGS